jgi:hypothetical protein
VSEEPVVKEFMHKKYRDMIIRFKKPWIEKDDTNICKLVGLYINEKCRDFEAKLKDMVGFKTFCNTQVSLYFCSDIFKLNYQL